MKKTKNLISLLFLLLLFACSKKDRTTAPGGGGNNLTGAGDIYFEWATDGLQKINLQTLVKSDVMKYNTSLNAFDITWDGKKILTSEDDPADYDAEVYKLINLSDGTIVFKFKKNSGYANLTSPVIAADESLIACGPTFDNGILIMDRSGKILHEFVSFQGDKFKGHVTWMPDNTLLISTSTSLYRTDNAFAHATLIKKFDFNSWGDIAVTRDGSRIALRGGNHIWTMNADGSSLVQVTDSNDQEASPYFSPDGKYLLVGNDYTPSLAGGGFYHICIIPADGARYNVNAGEDKNVLSVVSKGETAQQAFDGGIVWR